MLSLMAFDAVAGDGANDGRDASPLYCFVRVLGSRSRRFGGPVGTQRSFQGFACSCCGLQGMVLRGGFSGTGRWLHLMV